MKWVGQCPSCSQWNTFVEELVQKDTGKSTKEWKDYSIDERTGKSISLKDVKSSEEKRLQTADTELNRVLGERHCTQPSSTGGR